MSKGRDIKESRAIRDILSCIGIFTALVFDIDNTVQQAITALGSDQWFTQLMKRVSQQFPDKQKEVQEAVLAIYHAVQHHVRTSSIESSAVSLIRVLQDLGVPVIAITARSFSLENTTLRQLQEVGIDFGRYRWESAEKRNLVMKGKVSSAVYYQGIVYCNGLKKGDCFQALFNARVLPQFDHVLMVDDKGPHLENVDQAAQELNLGFSGLRYGHLDEKAAQDCLDEAHEQLRELLPRLPQEIHQHVKDLSLIQMGASSSTAAASSSQLFAPEPFRRMKKRKFEQMEAAPMLKRSVSAMSFLGAGVKQEEGRLVDEEEKEAPVKAIGRPGTPF